MNSFFNIISFTVDALPQAVFPSIYTIFEKFCRLISKPCFFAACFASLVLLKRTPFRCSLSFGNRKNQMGLDLGYKVDVAAIPIEILSKFSLSPLQNALEHCHDGRR